MVCYQDGQGLVRELPIAWTSLQPADVFEVVGEGRARFRAADLAELAALLERLLAPSGGS